MHDEFETNFFGTVRVAMKVVEVMRQAENHRGGLIFNISSLAGVAAFPGHAFYHASKFAVEGWTESVAREMHPDWNSQSKFSMLNYIFLVTFFLFFKCNGHLLTDLSSSPSQFLYRRTCRCEDEFRRPQQGQNKTPRSLRRCRHARPKA